MFAFLKSVLTSVTNALNSSSRSDEQYLSQSSDVCDLERRIRTLERRGNGFLV